MDVVSACALPVASVIWQPHPGAYALTVVCRATYRFDATGLALLAEHEPPLGADVYWSSDPRSSLRAASDLVPLKEYVDVVVTGHAFAPRGASVPHLVARLAVGDIDKSIEIHGDRHQLGADATLHEGAEFERMPLVYERAVGGPGTPNPVGLPREAELGAPLPNLLLRGTTSVAPRGAVAGMPAFGPISPSWALRRQLLGSAASRSSMEDLLAEVLPNDLDLAFFNHAPPDQQLAALRDGDVVVLEHLHPVHAYVRFELPSAHPQLTVERGGSVTTPSRMRLDTVTIETDRAVCSLTWRASLQIDGPHEAGRAVVTFDPRGEAAEELDAPAALQDLRDADRIRDLPFRSVRDEAADRSGRWSAPPVPAAPTSTSGHPASDSASDASLVGGGATLEFAIPDGMPHPPLVATVATAAAVHVAAVPHPPRVVAPAPSELPVVPAPAVPPPPPWQPPPLSVAPEAEGRWGSDVRPAPPPWVGSHAPSPSAARMVEPSPSPWMAPSRAGAGSPPLTVGQVAAIASQPAIPAVASGPPAAEERPAPPRGARMEKGEVLQLLWYDPDVVPRARRVAAYRDVLDELEQRARSSELDDVTNGTDPMAVEDRRDVFEILARCPAIADDGWSDDLLASAIDHDKFVPGLVLVGGELSVLFEEAAMLRALMTVATPLALGDEALKAALQDAREFLAMPDFLSPGSVVEAMSARIVDAFRKANRSPAPRYLESHAERALLERRSYQRREVFGAPHLRATLRVGGARGVPTYLPAVLSSKLPMFAKFRVRALAELHLPEDHMDTHVAALRVRALGRVATLAAPPSEAKGR